MTDTFDVDVTRDLDGPADRAWAAWSTPEGLRSWWGPGPFTCPAAEVDLRVGGRALVAMRAPAEYGGGDQWSTWDFSLVEPVRRIEYTFRFSDADGAPQDPPMPGVPAEGRHEVEITDLGGGRSRIHMVEHGYTTAEVRDMSREGLEACLDKMAAYVADGQA
ncbi:SRPBCC family protein [Promicromonospora sukumoe]